MKTPSVFEREYFIQTRKEIDTEKRERDKILNFIVLILGAIGFAIIRQEGHPDLINSPYTLIIEYAILIMITSLFWIRWKKLNQIAHRWYVLHKMCTDFYGDNRTNELMEGIVYKGLNSKKYITKDLILNYSLSIPIYLSILYQCKIFIKNNSKSESLLAIYCIGIIFHIIISFLILSRKCENPLLHND